MKPLFAGITEEQTKRLWNIGLGYLAWVVASIFAWCFVLPDEFKWIAYLPILFVVFVIVAFVAAVILNPILPKPVSHVYVGHKRVTCCQFCPMADIRDNIVNNSFPVVKCRETAKVCYNPKGIPRWCPYAD